MRPAARGLILAGLQLALVAGLGGKLLLDRWLLPRMWLRAEAVDPDLPGRGRYVRLRVRLPRHLQASAAPSVRPVRSGAGGPGAEQILAFFIPADGPDPIQRPPSEQLWVEVTVPRRGPLRPIRLGVLKAGRLTLLDP